MEVPHKQASKPSTPRVSAPVRQAAAVTCSHLDPCPVLLPYPKWHGTIRQRTRAVRSRDAAPQQLGAGATKQGVERHGRARHGSAAGRGGGDPAQQLAARRLHDGQGQRRVEQHANLGAGHIAVAGLRATQCAGLAHVLFESAQHTYGTKIGRCAGAVPYLCGSDKALSTHTALTHRVAAHVQQHIDHAEAFHPCVQYAPGCSTRPPRGRGSPGRPLRAAAGAAPSSRPQSRAC